MSASICFGQKDSLEFKQDTIKAKREYSKKKSQVKAKTTPSGIYKDSARLALEALPRKRAIQSAMLPGLGQWNNGGFWNRYIKVPAIYGGFVGIGLVFEFNNRYYHIFLKEAQYRSANPGQTLYPQYAPYSTVGIIAIKDAYRRNRDLSFLFAIGFHGINIIDAYIFAKFKRFDIGDDLGMKITPAIINPGGFSQHAFAYYPAIKLSLQLK